MKMLVKIALSTAALTIVTSAVPGLSQSVTRFAWPAEQLGAIADLRIADAVRDAEEAARFAVGRATEAHRAAAQAKRRAGLQGMFGLKPKRGTTDDGTVMSATRGMSGFDKLGTVSYPSGATLTGGLNTGLGEYVAGPASPLRTFTGFVFGAGSKQPNPVDGVFEWKNGDTFRGSITGDGSAAKGVYEQAGGNFRFVGIIDFTHATFRPVRGYLKSKAGKIVAVIGSSDQ